MPLPLVEQRLQATPERPGVYLMKDPRGTVLYVGKASVLRNRLRSYFGSPNNLPNKIRRMLGHLHDFEYIVTDSAAEALILENTLIKASAAYLYVGAELRRITLLTGAILTALIVLSLLL